MTGSLPPARRDDGAEAQLYYVLLGGSIEGVYGETITTPGGLITYIIKANNDAEEQLKIPYVMLFNDKIIDLKHGIFDPTITSPENPIKICWKYIKNGDLSLYNFFLHRNILPDFDLLWKDKLNRAIEMLQDKDFSPTENDIAFIQKSVATRRKRKNEGSVAPLISMLLNASLTKTESQTIIIQEQFRFIDVDKHEAIVDHVIFSGSISRPILICEDKFSMLNEGILQNFDQLRTFAASAKGLAFDVVYGITSNFNEWVFCCYVCPTWGKDITTNNFFTSQAYNLNFDPATSEPDFNSVKDIIQKIRGFLSKDIDKIVFSSFEKEGFTVVQKQVTNHTA